MQMLRLNSVWKDRLEIFCGAHKKGPGDQTGAGLKEDELARQSNGGVPEGGGGTSGTDSMNDTSSPY